MLQKNEVFLNFPHSIDEVKGLFGGSVGGLFLRGNLLLIRRGEIILVSRLKDTGGYRPPPPVCIAVG